MVGFDGLLHLPLVDNTAKRNNFNAKPTVDMFNQLRRMLGKYGLRPSELAFITDVSTYIAMQAVDSFQDAGQARPACDAAHRPAGRSRGRARDRVGATAPC